MPSRQVFSLVCFIMLMLMACISCQNQNSATVPEHLIGIWRSADARYADRYLEFSKNLVTFGTGSNSEATHHVQKVEPEKFDDNGIVYTFYYKDKERETGQLTLTYNPGPVPNIRLKNHREIWQLSESKDMKQ